MAGALAGAGIVWQTPANPPEAQDYIFRNGRRYVRPYYFEFVSHVKNRWAGKTIVDLFTEEFRGRPREYYVYAVKCGRLQVDEQMVHADYIVKSSQKISHFLHRHEPPVLGGNIVILQNEIDVVTVCKPASVPEFRVGIGWLDLTGCARSPLTASNSFPRAHAQLLHHKRLLKDPSRRHSWSNQTNSRLGGPEASHDRPRRRSMRQCQPEDTSAPIPACLQSCKSVMSATIPEQREQQIEANLLEKEYVARVVGVFPEGELTVDANVNFNAREGRSTVEVCDGSGKTLPCGKQACTKFQRICTDGNHSIVLCKPVTGRTHQIRVHLKHIGYPIANDELYLSGNFCPRSSKETSIHRATSLACPSSSSSDPDCGAEADAEFGIDPMCTNCPNLAPVGYDGDEEGLWLHCVRYTGPDWRYECPYPDWTSLDNVSRKKIKS